MSRRGHTMVELGVAAALLGVVLATAMTLFTSAARRSRRGIEEARGPAAALVLLNSLERDLLGVLQVPGDPRPPVAISEDGRELGFYRADPARSGPNVVVGAPVAWSLQEIPGTGLSHPTRDGRHLGSVLVAGWDFELLPPSAEEARASWFLRIRVDLAAGEGSEATFVARRAVPLLQPSTNFLHFPGHGVGVVPGSVRLLPWTAGAEVPRVLAPPREAP